MAPILNQQDKEYNCISVKASFNIEPACALHLKARRDQASVGRRTTVWSVVSPLVVQLH